MNKTGYVIACDFHKRVMRTNVVGTSTLTLTGSFEETPSMKVYLRDHSNMSEPHLNVKDVAEVFDSREEAIEVANKFNDMTFDEGKIVCRVESV